MAKKSPSLKGQVAIITGASAGIGKAISLALGKNGVKCVLAARRKELLDSVVAEIKSAGGEAMAVPTDVRDDAALSTLVKKAIKKFGALHILVNNAGIYGHVNVEDLEREFLEKVISINLIAPMMLTKYALPHLTKSSHSAVFNIASIAATMGFPSGSSYCASKSGLLGFSDCLFEEVRESGVKVCAILPGYVATPMVEKLDAKHDKMIPPEDIAQTILDVLAMSPRSCPSKIIIRPQVSPYKKS